MNPHPLKKLLALLYLAVFLAVPGISMAQDKVKTPAADTATMNRGRIVEILESRTETQEFLNDAPMEFQRLRVELIEGPEKGKVVTLDNDYTKMRVGQKLYVRYTAPESDGNGHYGVAEPDRLPALLAFLAIFIIVTVVFGGIQGVRGLVSLAGSLVLILFVLIPGILHGFSAILTSLVVASLIIVLGSYITHGFNRTTSAAVLGMIGTVVISGILAFIAVRWSSFTGYTEETTYLIISTGGRINLQGLLLGGILIGLLGVLYDVAIGQAIAVEELHKIAPHVSKTEVYQRAIRIGREHIGALVDTLAIAYVGASLPLLLLFHSAPTSGGILPTLNMEVFSSEIIRILIGSIGIILAVPITTVVSVWMIYPRKSQHVSGEILAREKHALLHAGHHH